MTPSGDDQTIRPSLTGDPETELRRCQLRSQRAFYRALEKGAADSHVVDLGTGVQAMLVPARPWYSIFNAVIYEDATELRAQLPRLRSLYEDAGVGSWSVWTRPGDADAIALLSQAGHREEASPLVMGAQIGAMELDSRLDVDLDRAPSWSEVARCNDQAHGVLPEFSMAAVFEEMQDSQTRLYAARDGDEIAASLLARHGNGDCYFWFVATVPEQQRKGLGEALMRVALCEAQLAGCRTATLESTGAAETLYRRLGFVGLGRSARWARYAS